MKELLLAAAMTLPAPPPAPAARPALDGIRISPEQAREIGRKIWNNESNGTLEGLTQWNHGEAFASLGIGHFIWYPEGPRGPFTESFPGLLDALESAGHELPAWLRGRPACPWRDRESFFADFDGERLGGLRALLARSIDVQALYAAKRLEQALPKVLEAAPPAKRETLRRRFYRVAEAPNGVYALVDYVNFKGEGVNPAERYNGKGWGLLQVLELMSDVEPGQPSVAAFARAADTALTRRVSNAPPERAERERGWLPGWRNRLKTYLEP